MEKKKPWQLVLIVAVLLLTIYNILPTIIYYSKPLRDPVTKERSDSVAASAIARVNG